MLTSITRNTRFVISRPFSSISDNLLEKLGSLSTQALVDGLWVMGWPCAQIGGLKPLTAADGESSLQDGKMVGKAVTLRFIPTRPDIVADKPKGGDSPEYVAFEKCGPSSVLVMESIAPLESVGGDIKFLRLKQRGLSGMVTNGSVRDTDEIMNYGFGCYCVGSTAKQGPQVMQPWEEGKEVNLGGTVVRPGDAIVGDQDGVVCVPAAVAEKVYSIAHGREVVRRC